MHIFKFNKKSTHIFTIQKNLFSSILLLMQFIDIEYK